MAERFPNETRHSASVSALATARLHNLTLAVPDLLIAAETSPAVRPEMCTLPPGLGAFMTTMRGFVRQPGLTAFAAFVAAVFLAAPAFAGPIVFSQPAQSPIQSVRASQTQGGLGLVFQTFDNFMLGVDTNIAGVQWLGSYFNSLVIDGSFNPAANATGFAVAFYSDNGLGAPGSLVASQTFSPAGAGQTFVSQQSPTFNSSLGLRGLQLQCGADQSVFRSGKHSILVERICDLASGFPNASAVGMERRQRRKRLVRLQHSRCAHRARRERSRVCAGGNRRGA